jgi:hypothetical protein
MDYGLWTNKGVPLRVRLYAHTAQALVTGRYPLRSLTQKRLQINNQKSAMAFPKEGASREYGPWAEASPLSGTFGSFLSRENGEAFLSTAENKQPRKTTSHPRQ